MMLILPTAYGASSGLVESLPVAIDCRAFVDGDQSRPYLKGSTANIKMRVSDKGYSADFSEVHAQFNQLRQSDVDLFPCIDTTYNMWIRHQLQSFCRKKSNCDVDVLMDGERQFFEGLSNEWARRPTIPARFLATDASYSSEGIFGVSAVMAFSENGFSCNGFDPKLSFFLGSDPSQREVLNSLTSNCKLDLLRAGMDHIAQMPWPEACDQLQWQSDPICIELKRRTQAHLEILKTYADVLPGQSSARLEEFLRCEPMKESTLMALDELMSSIEEDYYCDELEIGKGRLVNTQVFPSDRRTPVAGKYYLERNSTDEYTAHVKLNISNLQQAAVAGAQPVGQNSKDYLDYARQCIEDANQMMTGPGQKRLRIKINEHPKAPEHDVEIRDTDLRRSHKKAWRADIHCATITHEVFHMLGLCDEYREQWRGYQRDPQSGQVHYSETVDPALQVFALYNCRAQGPYFTIMDHEVATWKSAGQASNSKSKPTAQLLAPKHLDMILNPGCLKKNADYISCAQNAYTTKAPGYECESCVAECHEVPESCKDGSLEWLGLKGRIF